MSKQQAGFTLVELIISMVIISIALGGTLMTVNNAIFFSADPLVSQQSLAIGESYLEEILKKKFPKTPCPGGQRKNFRNICSYDGISQAPTDQNGDPIAELSAYTVSVSVDTSGAILNDLNSSNEVARVDVTVSHPGLASMTFSGYRTNH